MILDELDIPYEPKLLEFNETKEPQYLELNPNGRLPTIQDPNTNITIWEVSMLSNVLLANYADEIAVRSYRAVSHR